MFTPGSSKLPAFRSLPALALAASATVLLCTLLYYLPQHWHRGDPVLLPLTLVDRVVPFWPLSGLVYFAAFAFLAGTFLALRDFDAATRFLYANLLAQVVAALVFVLWPTTYPRADFPLPVDAGPLGSALVAFCRNADLPVNCLPSLHVSTVVLCLATQRHCIAAARRIFPLLLATGLLLAASTLTFRQHYLLDVIAGAVLGYASWWICFRYRRFALSPREVPPAGGNQRAARDLAVLFLGAALVPGSESLRRSDQIIGQIAYYELRHEFAPPEPDATNAIAASARGARPDGPARAGPGVWILAWQPPGRGRNTEGEIPQRRADHRRRA